MRDFQKEMKYYKASEQVGGLYAMRKFAPNAATPPGKLPHT